MEKWSTYSNWGDLFVAVCQLRGFDSTAALAHRMCAVIGDETNEALDSKIRSINNWKKGKNLPRQGNLDILGEILQVNGDPELHVAWVRLSQASPEPTTHREPLKENLHDTPVSPRHHLRSWHEWATRRDRLAGLMLLIAVAGLSFYGGVLWSQQDQVNTEKNLVYYRPELILKVGQVAVIHGYRGPCEGPAPTIEATEKRLPKSLKTGVLAVGKVGIRYSRTCEGLTPVRAVRFLAQRTGTERFKVFGDDVSVQVE